MEDFEIRRLIFSAFVLLLFFTFFLWMGLKGIESTMVIQEKQKALVKRIIEAQMETKKILEELGVSHSQVHPFSTSISSDRVGSSAPVEEAVKVSTLVSEEGILEEGNEIER